MINRIFCLLLLVSLTLPAASLPRLAVAEPLVGESLNRPQGELLWQVLEKECSRAWQEKGRFQLVERATYSDRLAASGLPSRGDWFAMPPEQSEKLTRLTGIDLLLVSKVQVARHHRLVLCLAVMDCQRGTFLPNHFLQRQFRSFDKLLGALPASVDQLFSEKNSERLLVIMPPNILNPTIPSSASGIVLSTLTNLLLQQQLRLAQSNDVERILRQNGIDPAQPIPPHNYPLIADFMQAGQLLTPQLTECSLNETHGRVSGLLKLTNANGELVALASFDRTLHFSTRHTPAKQMTLLYNTALKEAVSTLLPKMK